jgi:carbamoyl-phosphate synthase large subunit
MKKNNVYYLCEINARFGGGFPLSFYSGANLFEHLFNFKLKKELCMYSVDRYKENLLMLRFDNAIYKEYKLYQ